LTDEKKCVSFNFMFDKVIKYEGPLYELQPDSPQYKESLDRSIADRYAAFKTSQLPKFADTLSIVNTNIFESQIKNPIIESSSNNSPLDIFRVRLKEKISSLNYKSESDLQSAKTTLKLLDYLFLKSSTIKDTVNEYCSLENSRFSRCGLADDNPAESIMRYLAKSFYTQNSELILSIIDSKKSIQNGFLNSIRKRTSVFINNNFHYEATLAEDQKSKSIPSIMLFFYWLVNDKLPEDPYNF
jgi:hypothetical protein